MTALFNASIWDRWGITRINCRVDSSSAWPSFALAMQPEIMLFDEITSALDPELVGEVLDVLQPAGRRNDDDPGNT